jgi:hypothetical protein
MQLRRLNGCFGSVAVFVKVVVAWMGHATFLSL